jgi:hypothetical protein
MVEGGIEPYAQPLTIDDVYHLLRRMGVGRPMPKQNRS